MASASAKKIRPKYLSLPAILFQIRLPVPGWVSIPHRVSGALLVVIGLLIFTNRFTVIAKWLTPYLPVF